MNAIRTKLLIVDDSMIVRRLIERSFKIEDYEILTAPNGLEAMRIFETFAPDVVTMDITMPEMDGLACVREMIALRPQTMILVISALSDKFTAVEAVKRGAVGFLIKPFTSELLVEKMTQLFEDVDEFAEDELAEVEPRV